MGSGHRGKWHLIRCVSVGVEDTLVVLCSQPRISAEVWDTEYPCLLKVIWKKRNSYGNRLSWRWFSQVLWRSSRSRSRLEYTVEIIDCLIFTDLKRLAEDRDVWRATIIYEQDWWERSEREGEGERTIGLDAIVITL